MTLFVANLRFFTTDDELKQWFNDAGFFPSRVKIARYKETDESRGFGFVEFQVEENAREAITQLDGRALHDRRLFVKESEPPKANKK